MNQIDNIYNLAFSAGPKNCLGKNLALIETKTIITVFLSKFDYQILSPLQFKLKYTSLVDFKEPVIANITKINYSE